MDFITTHAAPVRITIDGKELFLERLRLPFLKRWAAKQQAAKVEEATKTIKDEEAKARVKAWFAGIPVDTLTLMQSAMTPDGVEAIVREVLAGRVDDDAIDSLIEEAEPMDLRNLAQDLFAAQKIVAKTAADSGEDKAEDPKAASNAASGVSATITAQT